MFESLSGFRYHYLNKARVTRSHAANTQIPGISSALTNQFVNFLDHLVTHLNWLSQVDAALEFSVKQTVIQRIVLRNKFAWVASGVNQKSAPLEVSVKPIQTQRKIHSSALRPDKSH